LSGDWLVPRVVDIAGFRLDQTSRPESRTRRDITAESATRGTRCLDLPLSVPPDLRTGQIEGNMPRNILVALAAMMAAGGIGYKKPWAGGPG
jgi:hypothetical protein